MTTAPIIVPCSGAPTCRGVALTVRPLTAWQRASDGAADHDADVLMQAHRAIRDGHILCLRPTADRPACVGLSPTQFAVASLQDDFAARALVVDPYDAEGNDLREAPMTLHARGDVVLVGDDLARIWDAAPGPSAATLAIMDEAQAHDVAVWEGSEAT